MITITTGEFGSFGRYMIVASNGFFRIYINGIYRTTKKSLKGAFGVVRKIGPIQSVFTEEK